MQAYKGSSHQTNHYKICWHTKIFPHQTKHYNMPHFQLSTSFSVSPAPRAKRTTMKMPHISSPRPYPRSHTPREEDEGTYCSTSSVSPAQRATVRG
uniref:Uncharacterized protein n=1 Tax=Triticum urartu TaxID=4572 RepID=A0A8R7QE81_TRIUA